jgi:hypothetical protein
MEKSRLRREAAKGQSASGLLAREGRCRLAYEAREKSAPPGESPFKRKKRPVRAASPAYPSPASFPSRSAAPASASSSSGGRPS